MTKRARPWQSTNNADVLETRKAATETGAESETLVAARGIGSAGRLGSRVA